MSDVQNRYGELVNVKLDGVPNIYNGGADYSDGADRFGYAMPVKSNNEKPARGNCDACDVSSRSSRGIECEFLDRDAVKSIEETLRRGFDVRIKPCKDGIKVIEEKSRVLYRPGDIEKTVAELLKQ